MTTPQQWKERLRNKGQAAVDSRRTYFLDPETGIMWDLQSEADGSPKISELSSYGPAEPGSPELEIVTRRGQRLRISQC